MMTASLLRLVITICTPIALAMATPACARTVDHMGPQWLDQTIYRPNCVLSDCACECPSERLCLPDCVRW